MKFIATADVILERPIKMPLPTKIKTLFDKMLDLPDNIIHTSFEHSYSWDQNDEYFDELQTTFEQYAQTTFGTKIVLNEIEFEQILANSFMTYRADKRFPQYIVSNDDATMWLQVPINIELGMLKEPYEAKNTQAVDTIVRRVTKEANKQAENIFAKYGLLELRVEEVTDENEPTPPLP